ncbi:MAG: hypothetical protein RL033_4365 [Pseudomonadota bacterium]|jgi:hypothetical protein
MRRSINRRRRCIDVALAGVVSSLTALGCAGHRLYGENALNFPGGVALEQAQPVPLRIGPEQIGIKYLRAGGLLFRWQGEQVLTAPFFTNYPLEELYFRRIEPDLEAIELGLSDPNLQLRNLDAILVGHSHYDHIGDVPVIAREYTRHSQLYVNRSGANMLHAYAELRPRLHVLEDLRGWQQISPHIRVLAIPSDHAPNLQLGSLPIRWGPGEVERPWTSPWSQHFLREQRVGQTYAFVIDFLDATPERKVAFRVHYQDAASAAPKGFLPKSEFGPGMDTRDVDLEVVCMPGRESLPAGAPRYPSGVLANTRAHHALVIHYEDFFRPIHAEGDWTEVRLLPNVAGAIATEFLSVLDAGIREARPGPCLHPQRVQGLCSRAYTVPLPGEWLLFDVRPSVGAEPTALSLTPLTSP